jgi:hypothetical protein
VSGSGQTHLCVSVSGGVADEHRIAVNDLTTLATVLQTAVRGVGAVLSGGRAGVGGRKKGSVEAATELQLVAEPHPGSITLELALAPEPEPIPGSEQPHLGERALEALIQGLGSLDESTDELPEGFDPGVLKTLNRLGPVLRRGHTVDFSLYGISANRLQACVDQRWLGTVERLIAKPLRAHLTLEGVLQMVDLGARPLQCRIDRGFLPSVMCLIPNELEPEVRAGLGKLVRVTGEGEFDRGSDEPRRVTVEHLELVTQVAGFDPERIREHAPWQELAEEQGVSVLRDPSQLGGVFGDDAELDEFLASLRDPGQTIA